MLRILSVDNLSGAPYRLEPPGLDHSLRFETPAHIHDLVAAGHFDAALLPTAGLPEFHSRAVPLGAYGIACRGPVRSVKLFSEVSLETVLRNRMPIYATPRSRTSIALLCVLCKRVYGGAPVLTPFYPQAAAHLLIGDAAYEFARNRGRQEHDIDLSDWWLAQTGLPFVFARWVVSPTLSAGARERLAAWLERCATHAATSEGVAEMASFESNAHEFEARRAYYQQLRVRLDEDALAGLDFFLELLESTRHEYSARIA
ncbi:MAG: hypothetical protein KF886_26260 [Candidatus Hydrogenedentes bacterium]|nr:hypothetical protein [Candidatus Hydrogenedentota bacterium]